jgi:ABC-2 type transport system ATP-binding protein
MIRVEGVEKRYGSFQALHRLDLHVRPGEVFGFLGPNGAGKTTTIRMFAGVLLPTAGRILIDGVDLAVDPVESKRRVGYVPDRPYLYEKLTAREFLRFIGRIYGMEPAEVERRSRQLLEENQLYDRADELIEAYSHGMKQRLVLSSALLHDPKALIVDEPMVGLDPHGARRIKGLFRRLAEEVCDRVGILYRGRLVALDTVEEILHSRTGANLEEVFLQITEEEAQGGSAIEERT